MKSLFSEDAFAEIKSRIQTLTPDQQPLWGKMQYKHLDHHLRQFGA